ncbi:hypothetical protein VTN49DRAFT_7582 [Thermomyces lanuginosus]|uniref:uncharacterized protein n=1 Tax=Thermomyces lanuginosus TaxID=5541 RepID=UPI0037434830
MAGFPNLKPAFTVQVIAEGAVTVGSSHRKNNLVVVPIVGGNIKPAPDASVPVDAEFVGTGADYIHNDPDGQHMRLNAHVVAKTKDGAFLYINYKGTVKLTPDVAKVLAGQGGDLVTPFGDSFTYFEIETGDERYKSLENGVFVGQGHFISQTGKNPIVEYNVSQVVVG